MSLSFQDKASFDADGVTMTKYALIMMALVFVFGVMAGRWSKR